MTQLGEQIGRSVRRARLDAGLSQSQLSKRLGYKHGRISKIEHGRYAPRIDTVVKLASALGVTSTTLLGDVDWRES